MLRKYFKILPNWRNFVKSGHTESHLIELQLAVDSVTRLGYFVVKSFQQK